MSRLALAALLLGAFAASPALAQQTFTVTTTADGGEGSLRDAIARANATPEADIIAFAIDGGGSYQEIALDTALTVTAPIVLDGDTQGCDTDEGLCIRLDGDTGAEPGFYGIELIEQAAGSTVRGLVLTRFGRVADENDARSGAIATNTSDHVIVGNYMGTDRTGLVTDPDGTPDSGDELGNGFGIVIESSGETVLGVQIGREGEGNVIAGTLFAGIKLVGDHISGTLIRGNHIGMGADGETLLGNFTHGISLAGIETVGDGNQIGEEDNPGAANYIAGNLRQGILVDDTDSTLIYSNVISGNGSGGIQLQDASNFSVIEGNLIGLGPEGEDAMPNGTVQGLARFEGFGVSIVSGASENVVLSNTISGNLLGGIVLGGTSPGDVLANVIAGNIIGLDAEGIEVVPNGIPGVAETGAGIVFFGAVAGVAASDVYHNLISGNTTAGIVMDGAGVGGNLIERNTIGLNDEDDDAPNGQAGILIRNGVTGNIIGATDFSEFNVIAANPVGIAIAPNAGVDNMVSGNLMAATLFNIDLGADGPTANDAGDADEGPNRLQNAPDIAQATFSGNTITVTYSVDTAPANASYPLTLQLYGVVAGDEPPQLFPFTATPTYAESDAQRMVTQSVTLTDDELPPPGTVFVLASVTDFQGNTSEVTTMPVSVAVEEGEDAEAFALALAPNAPNPFGSTTQIAFTLDEAGPARLDVYDLLGRRVALLVDGVQPQGEHTATFDATSLPSGTYVYRLRTERGTVTRTMTLVR